MTQREKSMISEEANKKPLRAEIQEARDELRQTADEIRLKLHLAGMDAKDAWNNLQPRIHEFERRFEQTTDVVEDELKAMGQDIVKHMRAIRDQLT